MKILIIYATKNGVAKRSAEFLAKELSQSNEIAIYNINDAPPPPDDFDVVVSASRRSVFILGIISPSVSSAR